MQVRQAGKAIDKLVSEPFAEIILVPLRTHIQEWQDGYRGNARFRNYRRPQLAIMLFLDYADTIDIRSRLLPRPR